MPIHLIWGDDGAAQDRTVENLIQKIIDPAWITINLSRLDGTDIFQANKALDEARTPPFGNGGRLVLVKRSPFCNGCSNDLAKYFEEILEIIPINTYLVLSNPNRPDGRLRTTKAIQKLVKSQKAYETKCLLPTIWDEAGQHQLVKQAAQSLGLEIEREAITSLVEAIGNDSSRLYSELNKLALHAEAEKIQKNTGQGKLLITAKTVNALIGGMSTNALQIGNSLLAEDYGEAISKFDSLVNTGEPVLRVISTLTGQVRGWLWVSLLESKGEKDVAVIAKAAGISNPKRIYVMRKQLQGRDPSKFLNLLSRLLKMEVELKRGAIPHDAFRDGLLSNR